MRQPTSKYGMVKEIMREASGNTAAKQGGRGQGGMDKSQYPPSAHDEGDPNELEPDMDADDCDQCQTSELQSMSVKPADNGYHVESSHKSKVPGKDGHSYHDHSNVFSHPRQVVNHVIRTLSAHHQGKKVGGAGGGAAGGM